MTNTNTTPDTLPVDTRRRMAPARGGRPTPAQRHALAFAVTRQDGGIPIDTNRRTADVLVREGWLTIAPYRITDAGRAAIGEPTTAAVADQAAPVADDQATRAARALDMPRTHTFVEGQGWTGPLTAWSSKGRTVTVGDTVTGPCATIGKVYTGTVVRIAWVHPGTGEIRTRIQLSDGAHRIVVVDTITPPVPVAASIIAVTATRAAVVLGHDVDPDGPAGRALAQSYADETGEPVAVYAVPHGDDQAARYAAHGPVQALPHVGTFQPTVTGPCWSGRSYAGIEPDACSARATTTVPASVWAPGSQTEYPANVPACAACAQEVWDAEDAAATRAEEHATMSDALT